MKHEKLVFHPAHHKCIIGANRTGGVIPKMKWPDVLVIMGFLLFAGLLLWYIFGNSPTMLQLMLGGLFYLYMALNKLNRETGEIKKDTEQLRKDVEHIQSVLNDTKADLTFIKKSFGREAS